MPTRASQMVDGFTGCWGFAEAGSTRDGNYQAAGVCLRSKCPWRYPHECFVHEPVKWDSDVVVTNHSLRCLETSEAAHENEPRLKVVPSCHEYDESINTNLI